jgi:hypothetical protein
MASGPVERLLALSEPQTRKYCFSEPSEVAGVTMEFRLTYRGKLPSATGSDTRAKDKHLIRKQLHRQLRVLWQDHRTLKSKLVPSSSEPDPGGPALVPLAGIHNPTAEVDRIANNFAHHGYRFVPLIRESEGLACSLYILFLRRDNPGNLVRSGGDIDNRLKVLLDALRMPKDLSELAGFPPEQDEDPFFCLLEDDVLINDISVTTDRLLTPKEDDENINDVMLVIHVNPAAIVI